MAVAMAHTLCIVVTLTCVYVVSSSAMNSTDTSHQNACMIKHMMRYYTSSDKLTLANMEHLFDAVTTGYHDRAPAHSKGTIQVCN